MFLPQQTKISNKQLALHIKQLEKEEQTKPEVRRREIIAEINEIEAKIIEKISEIKRVIKNKRGRTQIIKFRIEKREVTTNITEIQRIRRVYYKQLCTQKINKLE